ATGVTTTIDRRRTVLWNRAKKKNWRRCLTTYLQTCGVELGYWTGSVSMQLHMYQILSVTRWIW
ncbi:hypothetical protein BDR04DRAFT_1106696, partial [Suillus decipiens]